MKTRQGNALMAMLTLVLTALAGMALTSCQDNLASNVEGKWKGEVNIQDFDDDELDNMEAVFSFNKDNDKGGSMVMTFNMSYSGIQDDMHMKADMSFKLPGKWKATDDKTIDITFLLDKADLTIDKFDIKPSLNADEETLAGFAMAKELGMLDGDAMTSLLKNTVGEEMKKEFSGTESIKLKNVKVDGGVLTFNEADMGNVRLTRAN